jgi:hypothetical protein
MTRYSAILAAVLAAVTGLADETAAPLKPAHFARTRNIEMTPGAALYRVDLPEAVYKGVAHDDLRDIRVFNGEDSVVPSSFQLKPSEEVHTTEEKALTFFPIKGDETREYGSQSAVEVSTSGNQSVVVRFGGSQTARKTVTRGYLVDLKNEESALRRLDLDWKGAAENSFFNIRVESSNDLQSWDTVVSSFTLARFKYGNEKLEQKAVDLPELRAKYLRVTWDKRSPLDLQSLRGEFAQGKWIEPKRFTTKVGSTAMDNGDYVFNKSPVVADRIQVFLPVLNTVVRVEIDSKQDLEGAWSNRYRGILFRVQTAGGELASAPLKIDPVTHRYWRLRVVGKDASLGKTPPTFEFGWLAHQLFFLAQGAPPFKLAYGRREASTPDFGFYSLTGALANESGEIVPAASSLGEEIVQAQIPQPLAESKAEPHPYKKYALWASLLTAILITTLMALRLMKDLGSKPSPK